MNTDTLLVIIVALIPSVVFYFLVKAFEYEGRKRDDEYGC
jgi:phosphotransferase system  glucose/maltose/N-acetylglucosamine-specific IIC component